MADEKQNKPKVMKPKAVALTEKKSSKVKDENGNPKKVLTPLRYGHKFTDNDIQIIIDGLKRYRPLVRIADDLDCTYDGLRNFIKKTPVLSECQQRSLDGRIDIAESKLMEHIATGNLNAIIYFLNTQARSRGYGEHQTIDQTVNDKSNVRRIIIGDVSPEKVAEMKRIAEEATAAAKADIEPSQGN